MLLDFEHELGIGGVLGHGVELEERPDGLHGRFRVLDHPDGDEGARLVRDGVLTGFSVMFRPLQVAPAARSAPWSGSRLRLDRVAVPVLARAYRGRAGVRGPHAAGAGAAPVRPGAGRAAGAARSSSPRRAPGDVRVAFGDIVLAVIAVFVVLAFFKGWGAVTTSW